MLIFIKPQLNLLQKYNANEGFPYYLLDENHVNIDIKPYGENTKIFEAVLRFCKTAIT